MWPFRRKPKIVDLTEDAYDRWLRAQRPQPVAWFLSQPEEIQETLARLGDEHAVTAAVALGVAVADPVLAGAGADGDQGVEAEELLLRRWAAQEAARKLHPDPPPSMGGLSKRRRAADLASQRAKDAGRSLAGRQPDQGDQ